MGSVATLGLQGTCKKNEYRTSYSYVVHTVPTSCTCILMNGHYLEVTQVIHVHVKTKNQSLVPGHGFLSSC